MDQPPREIKILKRLYNFQGVFFLAIIVYLLVGLRVIAYFSPPPAEAYHVTGAGAGMAILFPFFLVGVFLLSLVFFLIARGISKDKHFEIGLALSGLGILGLLNGILNTFFFIQSLRYPANHIFTSADLGYLIYVICSLVFGITSLSCIYYSTRPNVKAFLLGYANRQEKHS